MLDFCKWCAVKSAKDLNDIVFELFFKESIVEFDNVESIELFVNSDKEENLTRELLIAKFLKLSKLFMRHTFSLVPSIFSCLLNDNLGIINELEWDLIDAASYLTNGFKDNTWNKKIKY